MSTLRQKPLVSDEEEGAILLLHYESIIHTYKKKICLAKAEKRSIKIIHKKFFKYLFFFLSYAIRLCEGGRGMCLQERAWAGEG